MKAVDFLVLAVAAIVWHFEPRYLDIPIFLAGVFVALAAGRILLGADKYFDR